MAGKKNGRSSKTDHVLSLLAGAGVEREEGVPSAGEAPTVQHPQVSPEREAPHLPQARPAAPGRHLAPPILEVARLHNEALSETIREALTQSLEEELAREEPSGEPEKNIAAQEVRPGAAEEAPPAEVPAPDAAQVPQTNKTPPADAEVFREELLPDIPDAAPETDKTVVREREAAAVPDGTLPDGAVFVNVMERLVDERLEKYVKLFGICSCPRCQADVRALALSRLPAKYVVLPASSMAPMMSLYQARFDSMVIAQVIQACKTVMESPRHTQ